MIHRRDKDNIAVDFQKKIKFGSQKTKKITH